MPVNREIKTIQKRNKYRYFLELRNCEKQIMRQRKMNANWMFDVMAE